VVWIELCPSRNLICSRSPPPLRQSFAHMLASLHKLLGSLKPLNFKVAADFHREFKVYASQQGISMVDLLQEGFKSLRERRG